MSVQCEGIRANGARCKQRQRGGRHCMYHMPPPAPLSAKAKQLLAWLVAFDDGRAVEFNVTQEESDALWELSSCHGRIGTSYFSGALGVTIVAGVASVRVCGWAHDVLQWSRSEAA